MAERFHGWRFFLLASVLFMYLMVKFQIFASRLLCVLDYDEFSFRKE